MRRVLLLCAALLVGCGGSYQPEALTAAKVTLAATHETIESICEINFKHASTDAELKKAQEECDVMRASYIAAAIATETWEKEAGMPCSKQP